MKLLPFFIQMIIAFGLMGWGQFVFAENYYWGHFSSPNTFNVSTPFEACQRTLSATGNTSINSITVQPHPSGEAFRKCS